MVAWNGGILPDADIMARSFRDDGSPRSADFRVNVYTTGSQAGPHVAFDGNEFVVVWSSSAQDGSDWGVFGRRFDKDGTPRSGEFRVNAFTTGRQFASAVAKYRREGSRAGFVVTWWDESANLGDVKARRYDQDAVAISGEILANSYVTGLQAGGDVAIAADGRFVISWTSDAQDGDRQGVFARRFAADGAPVGSDFQVNSVTVGYQNNSRVAIAGDGRFVVVWQQDDGAALGVFGQRFDAAGNRVGAEFRANTYTSGVQSEPDVGMNDRGDFVVTWHSAAQDGSSYGVFGQRFDKDGVRVGSEFPVNATTSDPQMTPSVGVDAVGNFTVAWASRNQGGANGWDPYAQRFGGILFTAIGVDGSPNPLGPEGPPFVSDGNGVLEPGETVVVETSWKNVSGVAQTLSGTVLSFTGPPGPTYSVPDPNASFGTIPSGATQSCAVTGDCYAVAVSGPRPVTHWDAVMEEGNNNIILGQAKLWNVHVGDSFTDVPRSSPYYTFIETVLHHGITAGCTATEYCPQAPVTREQMAVFVTVAAAGPLFAPPACGPVPMFADVPPSSPFCPWIEELARRGVVAGCGGGNYCPKVPVTREQMAVFVLRALDAGLNPPACTAGAEMFADVPASSPFCRWIEELARRGVVTGCGGGTYCPTANVLREQMAVFITRTFGLLLYGV